MSKSSEWKALKPGFSLWKFKDYLVERKISESVDSWADFQDDFGMFEQFEFDSEWAFSINFRAFIESAPKQTVAFE